MNPLFADDPHDPKHASKDEGYVLGRQKDKRINPAAELIRAKLDALYESEPNTRQETTEAVQMTRHRSKHQQFMHGLSQSGKPLAQIQQEWHNYYASLPDNEKHEVWREFYDTNKQQGRHHANTTAQHQTPATPVQSQVQHQPSPKPHVIASQHTPQHPPKKPMHPKRAALHKAKRELLHKIGVQERVQAKAKQHFKSLAIGLGFGALAVFIILFGFFNEVVIARFIQPGGSSETPIILSTDGIAPTSQPQLIIPKINVQLPVVYDVPSTQEEVIQEALDDGVIHYPSTVLPGEKGNAAYFGHSSNNIFNRGKYKFAFVLLNDLVPGDIFYLTNKGKVYTYRVYDKRIVKPNETWVLGNAPGKLATAALITCDPPGTTINRLVVWGEQINPDPTDNATASPPERTESEALPAQGPTMWGRFWNWITGS